MGGVGAGAGTVSTSQHPTYGADLRECVAHTPVELVETPAAGGPLPRTGRGDLGPNCCPQLTLEPLVRTTVVGHDQHPDLWREHNGEVAVVTEVQVWVLMGLFATLVAVMFAVIQRSLASGLDSILGELRSEVGGLRSEMGARFDAVDKRFDAVDRRMDGLDRDVHMLVNRAVSGDAD